MNIIRKSISALKRGGRWIKEIYANRRLIINLANSDFRMRYAASYLGTFWAFVQPVVNVIIYIFVFQFGLKATPPVSDVPYGLWMISGMVPWFFIFEALINATNSLIEYSYLVKKVIFKISILPIVKIITALYVHLFFIALAILVYLIGYRLDIHVIQVLYYSFAATVLVLGLSYFTSSVVIFFRDLAQVINIVLQFLMWLTPILWSIEIMGIPESMHWIFKLNPIYYITVGYRDAFINGVWFWEKPVWTIYFWCLTIVIGFIGAFTFKRLEKHFADVL